MEKAKKIIMAVNEELRRGFTPEEVESYKKILKSILEKLKLVDAEWEHFMGICHGTK